MLCACPCVSKHTDMKTNFGTSGPCLSLALLARSLALYWRAPYHDAQTHEHTYACADTQMHAEAQARTGTHIRSYIDRFRWNLHCQPTNWLLALPGPPAGPSSAVPVGSSSRCFCTCTICLHDSVEGGVGRENRPGRPVDRCALMCAHASLGSAHTLREYSRSGESRTA